MLLIRIVSPSGSIDPVILEQAENITVFDALNSSDEGVTFEIAKNAPKADILNPDNSGYVYFWEVWDTSTNERVNYGPITNITESGPSWRVTGAGRSALLDDLKSTHKSFYSPIDKFVDELRYENIAAEPRTQTMIWSGESASAENPNEEGVFDVLDWDDLYHTLSTRTKDFAIDDETGYIPIGKIEPPRSFFVSKQYWTGGGIGDTLIVDLGDTYDISKIKILFPWWGGKQRANNRTYDFKVAFANAVDPTEYATAGEWDVWKHPLRANEFNEIYSVTENRLVTFPQAPYVFNLGAANEDVGYEFNQFNVASGYDASVPLRYIRVSFQQTYAWYGTYYDNEVGHDGFLYQCDPDYVAGDDSFFGSKKGVMHNATFNDRVLESANDCNSSIVEIGAYKEIIGRDRIKPLALQRIDNNNLQIAYTHSPATSETRTTSAGRRRFEPGSFFRKFTVTYSGASSTYTKFFATDCSNCYPDGFNFGIQDSSQNLIYASDNSSGTNVSVRAHINCQFIIMKGSANAYVSSVDCWKGQTDPLSYGGSYSFSTTTGDTASVTFRGQSFKWYASIPQGKTPANVKIEIRHKLEVERAGSANQAAVIWSGWTTLENSYTLPSNIRAESVYEIPYESGDLLADTVYQIKITNLDGGYCSIDSFEGYWSGSYTMYNEDSTRLKVSDETAFKQIYDKRFSGGSMYKWNEPGRGVSFDFTGDRFFVVAARARNAGKLKLVIRKRDNLSGLFDIGNDDHVFIPGGDLTDGSITLDLATAGKKGNESTQYIIFDSDEYFTNGLPWDTYAVSINLKTPAETYSTTKNEVNSSNFKYRCSHCKADASGAVTTNKYVYLDGIGIHESVGLSVSFENTSHLEQLQNVASALQSEWDVSEQGIVLDPRVGTDTDISLREGDNTLVDFEVVHDVSKVASILYSSGADIDGLPLFTITEDKVAREILGRTVMRDNDFREIGDYQQLVGLSRTELRKRRYPEKRITVTHIGNLGLEPGDTFNLVTKKRGEMRVRVMKREISQSSSGITYNMECSIWPTII